MRRIAILLLAFTLLITPGCATVSNIMETFALDSLSKHNTAYSKAERRDRTHADVERHKEMYRR